MAKFVDNARNLAGINIQTGYIPISSISDQPNGAGVQGFGTVQDSTGVLGSGMGRSRAKKKKKPWPWPWPWPWRPGPGRVGNAAAAARGLDERAVRLADPFRLARRARRVEHHRHVLGAALGDFGVEETRVRAIELAADLLQPLEARDAFVIAQAARIVVVDMREAWNRGHRLEDLVDLLLILDDRVRDLAIRN